MTPEEIAFITGELAGLPKGPAWALRTLVRDLVRKGVPVEESLAYARRLKVILLLK